MREMPIPPSLKTSTKVLEVLVLRNNHPLELIMPLLDKITKSGMLRSNICPEGGLLLLNGPKCGSNVRGVRIGRLRIGTRPGKRGRRGKRCRTCLLYTSDAADE